MCAQPTDQGRTEYGYHDFLPAEVFKLGRDLRTAIDRELAPLGITTQQAALLLVARLHGGRGAAHLADPLGTDTAGMTRLLDRLEAKGLVTRHASPLDRRSLVIAPTEAGKALIPELISAFRRANDKLLQGVAGEEIEQFWSTIRRLRANLRAADQEQA
jgi:DNA-binding MarR family transcriptional regulator